MQKPDHGVPTSALPTRFYQLKTGHLPDRTAPCVDRSTPGHQLFVVPVEESDSRASFTNYPQWKSQQKTLWATVLVHFNKLKISKFYFLT